MSKKYDAGISTAYGAAVRGGYAGTYEQFCADLARLAEVLEEFLGFSVTIQTLAEGQQATASYENGVLSLGIPKGDTGNGIQSISLLSTVGLVKTYRITYTNGNVFDFPVADGKGISNTTLNADYTLTITYNDGTTWTSTSIRGEVGATPHLTIGTVETLPPSQSASATITGTDENPVLNLRIPKGDTGEVSQSEFDALSDDVNDLNRHLSDLESSMNAISEVEEPRNYAVLSQEYEWGIPSDMTVEYADGAVTFSYPYAYGNKANFGIIFDGLENGKTYNLSFELLSGGLADVSQIKISGLSASKAVYNVVSQISKSGSIYSCEFTASINSTTPYNALNLSMLRATSTTAKLGNFSLIENGATSKTKVNNDALVNVPETSLDEDTQDKLNISEVAYSDDNLIDFNKLTHGYIDSSNGTIHATGSSNSVTDFIPVVPGKFYYFKNVVYGYYAFYSSADVSGFLSGRTYQDERTNWFVQIPSGANYARFTVDENKLDSTWINTINKAPTGENIRVLDENVLTNAEYPENPCNYKGNEICIFKKILCIGDSLTEGVCNYYDGSTIINNVAFREYSYPTFLKALTGRDTTNAGLAGYTTAQWYAAKSSTDYSGYDACIIQLGVNDALGSGWTSDAETAMGNIVSKIKSENNGIKIYIATIIPAFSYSGSAFDAVSAGIRAFVKGLNDPTVILLDMAVYAHTKEDVAYNNGHLTAFGYLRLAEDYKAYISKAIASNRSLYRSVQLTGTDYSL